MKHFLRGIIVRTITASLVLMLAAGILAACTKDKSGDQEGGIAAPSTGDNNKKSNPNTTGPAGSTEVKLAPITYDDVTKKAIVDTAKNSAVPTVYVPQQTIADDKLDQVQGSSTEMTIKFNKMALTESGQEIKLPGQNEAEKSVSLKNGSGKWITSAGKSALYLKVGDTYVALSPKESVTQAEIEAVAETLAPLQ